MPFDLAKEALFASGVKEGAPIAEHKSKLDHVYQEFIQDMRPTNDLLTTAGVLFDWLWLKKPVRYKPRGHFRLTEVVDSQLNKDSQTVGNCLGLTLLYNCLLRNAGIVAGAIHLENAFGRGPHVLSTLKIKDSIIDIENSLSQGFDYKGHLNDPSRKVWGDRELVADIYLSRGNECYEDGEYREALRNYELASRLNPKYERASLNKAIALDKIGGLGKE